MSRCSLRLEQIHAPAASQPLAQNVDLDEFPPPGVVAPSYVTSGITHRAEGLRRDGRKRKDLRENLRHLVCRIPGSRPHVPDDFPLSRRIGIDLPKRHGL